ncbi:hypothetical protein FOZ62_008096 [Perkinsus olseni]|uniref:Uncharacterized protein n=1 Tax=Perkinsus olseni TaxID=32597 RepID=A0A7J6RHX9_PEROL|nr:hypothetical protein FOZ62_008096 [Perkinsus olseni]
MAGYSPTHCIVVLLLKCSLSLASTYENVLPRPRWYRIKQSDRGKISNLANLTIAVHPGRHKELGVINLDFQHSNGTLYHVGPVVPSRSKSSTHRRLRWDTFEDDLKERCWGLMPSRGVSQHEAAGGELPTRTLYAQMEDVSRAFSPQLLTATLSNTLICSSRGDEKVLYLGLATQAFGMSTEAHTKSEYLFVTMESVEDESQLNPLSGDMVPSASGEKHKKFPDRCGLYQIEPADKEKIKDLDDLTMNISPTPPQRPGRRAQVIHLRFPHINGSEYRVGPIIPTRVYDHSQRVRLSRSEDELKASCWGLRSSRKSKRTVARESLFQTPMLQMRSVSKVFTPNLSGVTLDSTLLCLKGDVSLRLGFRAEASKKGKDPPSKSHILFVTMMRVSGGSPGITADELGKEGLGSATDDQAEDLDSASESGAMQVDLVDGKRKAESEPTEAPLPKIAKSAEAEESRWDHLPPKKRYFKTNE